MRILINLLELQVNLCSAGVDIILNALETGADGSRDEAKQLFSDDANLLAQK